MAQSLAHTKWMCKYHIVFCPKYRRKIIYSQLRKDIQQIILDLCKWKSVEILEGHMMPDHTFAAVGITQNEYFHIHGKDYLALTLKRVFVFFSGYFVCHLIRIALPC